MSDQHRQLQNIRHTQKIIHMKSIEYPPHAENYPYEPYEFEDMDEVLSYAERVRKETIDSLYLQAKQIAFDYNDQKEEKLILLAIEIVWSYFQDKFPTTHYDIVLGGNGCGAPSDRANQPVDIGFISRVSLDHPLL